MLNNNIKANQALLDAMTELYDNNNEEFFVVSLVTVDGFLIKAFALKELESEGDKLAAMSSTICALSNSSAKELVKDEFKISTIETDKGNILFVKTVYLGVSCVLMTAAWGSKTLASTRYKTIRLAELIGEITE